MYIKNVNIHQNAFLRILLICMTAFSLASCVGEVQKAAKDVTESRGIEPPHDLKFTGIEEVRPIAHSKLEVYFRPASGGSKTYTYQIYYGNNPNPVNVTEEVMVKDYLGRFRHTLENLEQGTEYIVRVDVMDRKTKSELATTNTQKAMTFNNRVADFPGISSIRNAPGVVGTDTVIVDWTQAKVYGDLNLKKYDPDFYEIVLIESDKLDPRPEVVNDRSLTPSEGRYVFTLPYQEEVASASFQGLKSNTLYYAFVRCLHDNSIEDPNNPHLRGEMNYRYLQIKTLSVDASFINYDPEAFIVTPNNGEDGLRSLKVSWGEFDGLFEHFRIFYKKGTGVLNVADPTTCVPRSNGDLENGDIFCKKVDFSSRGVNINDLVALSDYLVQLYVCLDNTCTDRIALPFREARTETNIASFSGINGFELAKTAEDLGSLKVKFPVPNFTDGYFSGLELRFTTDSAGIEQYKSSGAGLDQVNGIYPVEMSPVVEHELTHDYYDLNDTVIDVEGLDYSHDAEYCFALIPYTLDGAGDKVYQESEQAWKCVVVEAIPPTSFFPLQQATDVGGNSYNLSFFWNAPLLGIYTNYELFIKKAPGFFHFEDAIQSYNPPYDITYDRILIPRRIDGQLVSSYSLQNLEPGDYYIGMLSYYNSGLFEVRSAFPPKVLRCQVDLTTVNCAPQSY